MNICQRAHTSKHHSVGTSALSFVKIAIRGPGAEIDPEALTLGLYAFSSPDDAMRIFCSRRPVTLCCDKLCSDAR